jgi:hypothetical protein
MVLMPNGYNRIAERSLGLTLLFVEVLDYILCLDPNNAATRKAENISRTLLVELHPSTAHFHFTAVHSKAKDSHLADHLYEWSRYLAGLGHVSPLQVCVE